MKFSFHDSVSRATALSWVLIALAPFLSPCAVSMAADIAVGPGEEITIPLPITNADENGEAGGDTISSMKVVITGDSQFVTNPVDSAADSIPPGESRTFRPKFTVSPSATDGQTFTVKLKIVSTDLGLDPPPSDPASETSVILDIDPANFLVGRRQSTFSKRAGKTRENLGLPEFYHRDPNRGAEDRNVA